MLEEKLIHIGTFGEPVGLKGEIKVRTYTSNFKFFLEYGHIVNEGCKKIWDLKIVRISKNKIVVKVNNKDTLQSIETLKEKKLFVKRISLPKTKKDEFYIFDLINCEVLSTENKYIGLVQNIESYGASDLINIIQKNKKTFLVPMNKENIVSIDLKNKIIVLDPIKGVLY